MRTLIGAAIVVVAVAMLILATQLGGGGVRADVNPATIDFEGLAEGAIVSSVTCSSGMTCTADPGGSVTVFGLSPTFPAATNTAMIFDADCTLDGVDPCTGGDDDLRFPAQGNILIICEEQGTSNTCKSPPDDADKKNAFFKFDFANPGWGPGTVCVDSIDVMDVETVEGGAKVELFSGGEDATDLGTFALPITGDNVLGTALIDVCGVDFMRVTLNGSGAIDNIKIELEVPDGDGEACTPGFWKNLRKHLDEWVAASTDPNADFDTTFGVTFFTPDKTLGQAVKLGGSGVKKLARFGVAALLSARHPGVNFPLTEAQVIALVQAGDPNAFDSFFDDEDCPL